MKKLFLLAAVLLLAACKHDLTQEESNVAELGAVKYAQAAGGTFVSCSGVDSDGDSYVSCEYKDAKQAIIPIVCSYKGSPGCKTKA